ncbi:MAG: CBS domain-containing protein [Alphaproteobacteria bacterium]|nr:CBS domain-containing protein [Alphaproteobacteria bacterium]
MQVSAILKEKGREVVTADPDTPISEIVVTLKDRGIGAVIVAGEGDIPAGILSERDIVRAMPKHGAKLMTMRASDLMTREVVTCTQEHTIDEVMKIMTEGRFRHLPVIEGGKLVGVISIGDAVKRRLGELEAEAGALRSYIASG